jgi:hypothetical protein
MQTPIMRTSFPARLFYMLLNGDATLLHWSPDGSEVRVPEDRMDMVAFRLGLAKTRGVYSQMRNYGFDYRVISWGVRRMCIFKHPHFRRGSSPSLLSDDITIAETALNFEDVVNDLPPHEDDARTLEQVMAELPPLVQIADW